MRPFTTVIVSGFFIWGGLSLIADTNQKDPAIPPDLPIPAVVTPPVKEAATTVSKIPDNAVDLAELLDSPEMKSKKGSMNGKITIPAGIYRLSKTIVLNLTKLGRVSVKGTGPVTIYMDGSGPAFRFTGSMSGTASPRSIKPETWNEVMPMIEGIEIVGTHPEADGIEFIQTLKPTISTMLIRNCRHGIILSKRNRNVLISHTHVYNGTGKGIFLNHVDLHQINITGSHISYNLEGGIVVLGGNVRNLHVTGCDIEANMTPESIPTTSANILIDQSSARESIAEVAITGCTIQHSAHYGKTTIAPGGANIRILGIKDSPQVPNMINITGNVISDTTCHVHLKNVHDVTLTGNNYFATEPTDILVEESQRVTIGHSAFNPRESKGTGGIIMKNCSACLINALTTQDLVGYQGAIQLEKCEQVHISNCMITGSKNGVEVLDSIACTVTNNQISSLPKEGKAVVGDIQSHIVKDNTLHFQPIDLNQPVEKMK